MTDTAIIEANIEVHRALVAAGEYQNSPHFLPENKRRVSQKLQTDVLQRFSGKPIDAIDFGCGTGFMIDLLVEFVECVHGIDITQEMLDEVDLSSGKVSLSLGQVENTPFKQNQFDLATAYSFLDHLSDIRIFLEETHRVLKPGGVFYTGLNPNKAFSDLLRSTAQNYPQEAAMSGIVEREITCALDNGSYYQEKFGIAKNALELAESIKTKYGGIDAFDLKEMALDIGFREAAISYEWFLGQAHYTALPAANASIQSYLDSVMPASLPLFKYFNLVCVK